MLVHHKYFDDVLIFQVVLIGVKIQNTMNHFYNSV